MTLKSRIMNREDVTGLWQVLPGASAAEIAGQAGFDFLVLDGEHGPWDPTDLRNRLIASATECVIRVPANEPWLIKQALDLGARTILVPMVNSVEDAKGAVAAAKYPPDGIRGNGAYVARAADYGQDPNYVARANTETSIWVQAESRAALEQLEDIAAIGGIDCIFLGPADLAADMGHTTEPGHPDVAAAIEDAISRIAATGISCGAFGPPAQMEVWRTLGCNVLSAGADGTALAAALAALLR